MPKIIVPSHYTKPNSHQKFGNYFKNIATRKGAILRTSLAMRAMNPGTRNL